MTSVRLCFVCMGNICRSPTAAGVMRHLVAEAGLSAEVSIDSAGTGGWHAGELPDERARSEALRRGVDIDDPARKFVVDDFERFDLILAMDHDNRRSLHEMTADPARRAKVRLLREFDPLSPPDAVVGDPYYGDGDGFAEVFEVVDAACRGLLERLVVDGLVTGSGPTTSADR